VNGVVAGITLRQLLSRRRTLLLVLLAGLMLLVALGLRIGADPITRQANSARLLEIFGTATLMPLVALLFGTAALGSEIEEGTAIYLLAKPVPRWVVLLTKVVIATVCSMLLTCIPVLLAGLIAGAGLRPHLGGSAGRAVRRHADLQRAAAHPGDRRCPGQRPLRRLLRSPAAGHRAGGRRAGPGHGAGHRIPPAGAH
jgi:hypothetical protein